MSSSSLQVTAAPPDPIFAVSMRCKNDTDPNKVDLSIGAYRSDDGQPWVLPIVRKVEQQITADTSLNHEYQPLTGNAKFNTASAKLLFGQDADVSRIASVQTLSGTGANHMGAVLLQRFPPFGNNNRRIWVPTPTWGNHHSIFGWAHLEVKSYPYWDAKQCQLNFDGMISTLENEAEKGDTVLLHACAHNPTGVDPTRDQWKKIAELVKKKGLFVFFDSAYQGFASGDLDRDAWAVRYFVEQKIDLLACQSFSKNMGLYGERCGAIHIVLGDSTPEIAKDLSSQIASQTRAEISNTPAFGSRIVEHILTNPANFEQWKAEVKLMADRIITMRHSLRNGLEKLNTPGTWRHITDQIGMFSFTGLSEKQCRRLVDEFHIYLLSNGRISMAGLNSSNVEYVAKSIHKVVSEDQGRL